MKNYVYIATSLDGYIAGPGGEIDWLNDIPNPEGSDFGFAEFMQDIDALLMGRNTFDVLTGFDQWIYDKPVFVWSSTLAELSAKYAGKAEIVRGSLEEVLGRLHERGYLNLYIDGGKTVQSFLADDRIDEMIITTVPILLGKGIPLFGTMDTRLHFRHVKTETFSNGLVKNRYVRERG